MWGGAVHQQCCAHIWCDHERSPTGRIFGALAIPVAIGAVLGSGSWASSSRWFLGAALILPWCV